MVEPGRDERAVLIMRINLCIVDKPSIYSTVLTDTHSRFIKDEVASRRASKSPHFVIDYYSNSELHRGVREYSWGVGKGAAL